MKEQDREEIIIMIVENFWKRPLFFARPFMKLLGKPTTKGEMMTMMMNKYDEEFGKDLK